jgi:hypothetical protein
VEEGRQIESGRAAEPSDKVVRLPRDWLGPREHLVPFGTAASPVTESEPAGLAPSADDFWGERSAAIHDAVQAPETPPPADASAPNPRLPRRSLLAAGLMAAAAAVAFVLLSGGSPRHIPGGARLNIAALLNRGASKIEPPRIVAQASKTRIVKHIRHRSPRPKPKPAPPHHPISHSAPSTYVARVTTSPTRPTYNPVVTTPAPRVYRTRPPAASPASSGASVSPTGQSGALGPVHSPNG